ncbi:sulfatase-like hydrolase/transferase [bacterium]|nr:sulfatase-like hydrolase/transferase [candidate division CSSED10-310 bacterium]
MIMFNDDFSIKQYLGEGWDLSKRQKEDNFPWPCLTTKGYINLNWSQALDRRIAIKLLNVNLKTIKDHIEVTLNGHPVISIPPTNQVGGLEYFLPSAYQEKGANSIGIQVTTDDNKRINTSDYIAIHSVIITHGAALKAPVTIDHQIRPSVMLASPISIRFPVLLNKPHYLEMSYGFIEASMTHHQIPLSFIVRIQSKSSNHLIRQYSLTFSSDELTTTWTKKRFIIPSVPKEEAYVSFEFRSNEEMQSPVYFVISECHLFPQTEEIAFPADKLSTDILFITVTSLGSNTLACYGNDQAKTPFLDRMAKLGFQYSDAMSPTNFDRGTIMAIASGNFYKDLEIQEKNSQNPPLGLSLPKIFRNNNYTTSAILNGGELDAKIFSNIVGLERIYLSKPSLQELDKLSSLLSSVYTSQASPVNPSFVWIHLNIDAITLNEKIQCFHPSDYYPDPIDVGKMNLPQSDINRLIKLLPDNSDLRVYLSLKDSLITMTDKLIESLVYLHRDLRNSKKLLICVTATNGLIRSPSNNIFSNDSLCQEVISVPYLYLYITDQPSIPAIESSTFIINSIGNNMFKQLNNFAFEQWPGVKEPNTDTTPLLFFSEHGTRRIVAHRQNNWKMIYCFSEPYYRISNENLFNLGDDPGENLNVLSQFPAIGAQLKENIIRFGQTSQLYPTPKPGIRDEAKEVLESLNYTD